MCPTPRGYVTKKGVTLSYRQRLVLSANAYGRVSLPYGEKVLTRKKAYSTLSEMI